jgi:group I intron endonuclease
MVAYIYKLTNKINGKCYIGKTVNLVKRLSGHKCDRRSHAPILKAINKYGWDNFEYEVLWEGSRELMNEMEIHYIAEYGTYKGDGYNCTPGGDGYPEGIDNPLYGKPRTNAVKKKISETKKKNHPYKGKFPPWLWKGQPEGDKHPNATSYVVISPDGTEIKIKGICKFCRENNLTPANMIKVAKGERNTHKGWKCKYAD